MNRDASNLLIKLERISKNLEFNRTIKSVLSILKKLILYNNKYETSQLAPADYCTSI